MTKDNIKNRVALLITNIKFTNERFNRKGAEKDEENMETLLKALGYEVVKHTNLTGKVTMEIKQTNKQKNRQTFWLNWGHNE